MSWEEIKAHVESKSNIATITMEKLRNAHGSAKLGVHVRTEISNILAGMGLGHVPVELPSYQHEQVRCTNRGLPRAISFAWCCPRVNRQTRNSGRTCQTNDRAIYQS